MECWTATAADIEAWLKHARPGDRFVYAKGPTLVQGAAAALVRKLNDSGEVHAHSLRAADGGLDYIAVRNRVRTSVQRSPVVDPNMLAVLVVIQDAAASAERCPSDAAIAAETGLTADQVKWQLKKLEAAQMIAKRVVAARGDSRFRIVKVIATGVETAGPEAGK